MTQPFPPASASPSDSAGRGEGDGSDPTAPSSSGRDSKQQQLREVGCLGAWSVTSAKPGNGVELLRDGSTETYWQSDGTQPHLINIQFNKRVDVSEVRLYLDYKADESYTPSRLSIRAGCSFHDLEDVCIVELREPTGWIAIPLSSPASSSSSSSSSQQQQPGSSAPSAAAEEQPLRAFFFQVAVLANHQNGRDTHIRQILLFGPCVRQGPMTSVGGGGSLASQLQSCLSGGMR